MDGGSIGSPDSTDDTLIDGSGGGGTMHRRTLLGTVVAGFGTVIAGCGGDTVEGSVVANETPLVLSHEYAIQGTPSGTRLVVDVSAENGGSEPISTDGEVPRVTCVFLNGVGETLHRSGVEPLERIGPGETSPFEFQLGTGVDEVTRYELSAEWVGATA